jgi:DNA polymerase
MITLPSGRTLMYPTPRITADGTITYAGAKNKRWTRIKTYGGKILENITQAASRDILAASMLRINRQYGVDRWVYKTDAFGNTIGEGFNAAGVRIVLDVYDEIVCEVDKDDDFNLATMNNILTAELPWTAGLPLAAEGFEGYRYAKH